MTTEFGKDFISAFAKDFISAQNEIGTLPKDKSGYGYKYTDFDTVVSTVKPILARHNLGFCQMLESDGNGRSGVRTILFHSSGESVQAWFELPQVVVGKANNAQNVGASITYIKRYALCSVLGCSSDEDTDCATPQKQEPKKNYTQTKTNYPITEDW